MRILHLANTPLSNSPSNIASVQRHIGHESRVLLHQKSNRNKVFVGGDLWAEWGQDELTDIFEKSDVIHFHNFTWSQAIFNSHPHLRPIAKSKKCYVQFHSARKSHENFEETIADPIFENRRLVIAQYHPREYPECEWLVPNPIPMHEDRFRLIRRGKWTDYPPLTVSYAPSNAHLKGWDYKGYDQIAPVLKNFRYPGVERDIIFGVPYEECLTRKSYSHVGIEEFFTGSYHLSFLEYMALQCAPVGYLDQQTMKAMESVVGEAAVMNLPYLEVKSQADLKNALAGMLEEPRLVRDMALKARLWMEQNWSSEMTAKAYINIYEKT